MKFTFRPSPNARDTGSTKGVMFELTLALLAVFVFALVFYYVEYGMSYVIHALVLMATSVLVAAIVEVLWCVFLKKDLKKHLSSSFPWVTAIILVLMVPISTTYYALAFGSFFAIFFAKLLFGGFGHNIFNPAAAGRAAMLTSFAAAVTVDMTTGPTPVASTKPFWANCLVSLADCKDYFWDGIPVESGKPVHYLSSSSELTWHLEKFLTGVFRYFMSVPYLCWLRSSHWYAV